MDKVKFTMQNWFDIHWFSLWHMEEMGKTCLISVALISKYNYSTSVCYIHYIVSKKLFKLTREQVLTSSSYASCKVMIIGRHH